MRFKWEKEEGVRENERQQEREGEKERGYILASVVAVGGEGGLSGRWRKE